MNRNPKITTREDTEKLCLLRLVQDGHASAQTQTSMLGLDDSLVTSVQRALGRMIDEGLLYCEGDQVCTTAYGHEWLTNQSP